MTSDPFSKWQPKELGTQESDPFAKWVSSGKPENTIPPRKNLPEDFNWFQRHFTAEGQEAVAQENRDFFKSILSSATAGGSEYFDVLKPNPESHKNIPGQFVGAAVPIGLTAKAISYPFKAINGLLNFGKVSGGTLQIAEAATVGAGYGAEKEAVKALKGEEFEPSNIAQESATFAGLATILKTLPGVSNWIKDKLSVKQQADILLKGVIPDNLTPNQYKFWEDEAIPAIQKAAEKEYKTALAESTQKSDMEYAQKKAELIAEHEAEQYQNEAGQTVYQNKLKQLAAEHESEVAEIQKANDQALKEFEIQKREYALLQARQNAVAEATRLKPGEETKAYREAPNEEVNPSVENKVGNLISRNEPINATNAGKANIEAVRANDAIDYQVVNEAYKKSDELNEGVNAIHPKLVQDLTQKAAEIESIPEPSPPQKQLLTAINKTLDQLRTVDEAGNITGLLEVNNRILQEQAKAFRYFMDFNFEHGNARGIFSPTVRNLEDAVETGAIFAGKPEAAEASKEARALYRKWAEDYDNEYIRPYRDTRNFDYRKTFNSALDLDEFNMLNRILTRSNEGQQLAGSTKRALVEKHLKPFLDNPQSANLAEFEKTLRELRPVIDQEQENLIREAFLKERKVPRPKEPTQPKLKEIPGAKIPLASQVHKAVKLPTKPKIEVTDAMKMASKRMDLTPEEGMRLTKTPSGMKEVKKLLSKTESDKLLFEKIGKQKLRDIAYQGKIKHEFTGNEFYKVFNEGENFQMLSEIVGETEAEDILQAAKQLSEKRATVDSMKKYLKKAGAVKALILFNIL